MKQSDATSRPGGPRAMGVLLLTLVAMALVVPFSSWIMVQTQRLYETLYAEVGPSGTIAAASVLLGLAIVVLALPILRRRQRLARAKELLSHCEGCGYDMAGLGTLAVCPECGRAYLEDRAIRRAQRLSGTDRVICSRELPAAFARVTRRGRESNRR